MGAPEGFPGDSVVRNLPANGGDIENSGSIPESGRFPWNREWQPTPVFLPEKFHGEKILAGCSPQGHKESDMAEWPSTDTGH